MNIDTKIIARTVKFAVSNISQYDFGSLWSTVFSLRGKIFFLTNLLSFIWGEYSLMMTFMLEPFCFTNSIISINSTIIIIVECYETTSVVLAWLISALKVVGGSLTDHRFLFLGAGEVNP